MSDKFTPGPWPVSDYAPVGGYDGMFGAIYIGNHITLDGSDYGQTPSTYGDAVDPKMLERMQADARLIAVSPDMFRLLEALATDPEVHSESPDECDEALALIKKVKGEL